MCFTPEIPVFPWWIILIWGIVTFLLGIAFVTFPFGTLLLMVTFVGAYWFISGLLGLFTLAVDRSNLGWKIFFGVLGIIAGIAILAYPYYSAVLVPYLFIIMVGVLGLIMGFMSMVAAFMGHDWGAGIVGAFLVIFGCVLLANPLVSTILLPFVLGALGIIGGIVAIVWSLYLRGHPEKETPA
jgi:uncharacterized membrane protein HdeD (DUF308 family)